ncbi:MAG: cell filamentation protein Fic [Verrucomicrobia bacterium]|nr:cell filamentation protein Fic [Verrucomicrobiota bacterium]
MNEHDFHVRGIRPAGYEALILRFQLEVIPNWHRSFIATGNTHKINASAGITREIYPARYWPGNALGDHLEFALKYDGTNLAILTSVFKMAPQEEIQQYVDSAPRGKYARRLWYLYEFLTGTVLPSADLKTGGYIDLLDPDEYYTVTVPRPVRRQRVNDNLLGDARFCPTIRRTDALRAFEKAEIPLRCQKIVANYPPQLLKRAMSYLYTKETKSSFEIEHINPNPTRTERFIALLQLAESEDFCEKGRLLELQNRIVDPRFRDTDYRTYQNYVGETVGPQKEKVHFVCPKPADLGGLMDGLIAAHKRMDAGNVSVVAHAAAVAYGFVFLHPFEDGNGRVHRFLIHNILARRKFTPAGIIFPVSAAMLNDLVDYDGSLESFSHPLMELVEYSLDEQGRVTVKNDTANWYKFIDMTPQVEALCRFIQRTMDKDLVEELAFLANYDQTKKAIQDIVDMPDRKIDLFIQACLQNNGRLSARKRASHFEFLSDVEVTRMEEAIQSAYRNGERKAQ